MTCVFYNLYSWKIRFRIRYGKSTHVERTKCMQKIVCGCSPKNLGSPKEATHIPAVVPWISEGLSVAASNSCREVCPDVVSTILDLNGLPDSCNALVDSRPVDEQRRPTVIRMNAKEFALNTAAVRREAQKEPVIQGRERDRCREAPTPLQSPPGTGNQETTASCSGMPKKRRAILDRADVKGSAIGNLAGLLAPLRKHKPERPTSSRDKPLFDDRALKSSKKKQNENIGETVGCGSSK
ncbi:hypothetical protein TRIUR3_04924 [Triticum urartu]|uniref:Uncharacterized protein n=1 Tax=Triticum urartu TaxID=4572 RepID=M7ZJ90_TRIUA|nr:hypothetical protein TRIUR3_04924 [Triticum urartu]